MLRVSSRQWSDLASHSTTRFHQRLAAYLRSEVPEATAEMPEADLMSFIQGAHRDAQSVGIESEAGVTQFACLALAFGRDFFRVPEVSEFWAIPDLSAEEKLDELVHYMAMAEENGRANVLTSLMGPDR